jgi:hypothetical protein
MVSSSSSASLNYDISSVDFKEAFRADIDRQDLFFQAQSQTARSDLTLDLGATLVKRFGEEATEPLYRFTWNRRHTARSSTGLSLVREVSDSGRDVLIRGQSDPLLAPAGSIRGFLLFVDKRANAFYTIAGRRTSATVSVFARKRDFVLNSQDENNVGGRFEIGHTLRRRLTGTFFLSAEKQEFPNPPEQTNRDRAFGLRLTSRVGRGTFIGAGARWRDRNSDNPARDYRETRVSLEIGYTSANLQR